MDDRLQTLTRADLTVPRILIWLYKANTIGFLMNI